MEYVPESTQKHIDDLVKTINKLNQERNKLTSENKVLKQQLRIAVVRNSALPNKHPLCKGDGIDHCDYYTTIDCDECKYGGGRKNPEAKCNQMK